MQLRIILLALPLLLSSCLCSSTVKNIIEDEGPEGAIIEHRYRSSYRTGFHSLHLVHDGDEFQLTRDHETTRREGHRIFSEAGGRRFQWFDGQDWYVVYRPKKRMLQGCASPGLFARFVIRDPRPRSERTDWGLVAPLLSAGADWVEAGHVPKRSTGISYLLLSATDYPAGERAEFARRLAYVSKNNEANKYWLKLAKGLPKKDRAWLEDSIAAAVVAALDRGEACGEPEAFTLIRLSQESASPPPALTRILQDERSRAEFTVPTFVALARAVAQVDGPLAGAEACVWFSTPPKGNPEQAARFPILPLLALTETSCPAATDYASTLGYCCADSCRRENSYRSAADLWTQSDELTSEDRDGVLLSYLVDTGNFPHLPNYATALARLDYQQPPVAVSCTNAGEAGLACGCDLRDFRTSACRQHGKTEFVLKAQNCKVHVDDQAAVFSPVTAFESRATEVFIDTEGGFNCKYKNPPFAANEMESYQWLASGKPFTRVQGPYDPSSLKQRDLPDSLPADSEFTCVVTFTERGHLLKDLKEGDTPAPNKEAYRSLPARMR